MGADVICSSATENECLSKLDEYRHELGDNSRLQMLMSACSADDLTAIDGLDSADDLTSIDGLASTEVVAAVEEDVEEDASKGSDQQGQGYLQAATSKCDAHTCDELDDAKCIATLDATVAAMSDDTRLSFEMEFKGANAICKQLTDEDCLSLLDTYRLLLTDTQRRQVMLGACASLATESTQDAAPAPNDVPPPPTDETQVCDHLFEELELGGRFWNGFTGLGRARAINTAQLVTSLKT